MQARILQRVGTGTAFGHTSEGIPCRSAVLPFLDGPLQEATKRAPLSSRHSAAENRIADLGHCIGHKGNSAMLRRTLEVALHMTVDLAESRSRSSTLPLRLHC